MRAGAGRVKTSDRPHGGPDTTSLPNPFSCWATARGDYFAYDPKGIEPRIARITRIPGELGRRPNRAGVSREVSSRANKAGSIREVVAATKHLLLRSALKIRQTFATAKKYGVFSSCAGEALHHGRLLSTFCSQASIAQIALGSQRY